MHFKFDCLLCLPLLRLPLFIQYNTTQSRSTGGVCVLHYILYRETLGKDSELRSLGKDSDLRSMHINCYHLLATLNQPMELIFSSSSSSISESTTLLNSRIFAHMESSTQYQRCYLGSYNYYTTCPLAQNPYMHGVEAFGLLVSVGQHIGSCRCSYNIFLGSPNKLIFIIVLSYFFIFDQIYRKT